MQNYKLQGGMRIWGFLLRDFEGENLGQVRGPEVRSKGQQTVKDATKVWTCIRTEGLQTAGIAPHYSCVFKPVLFLKSFAWVMGFFSTAAKAALLLPVRELCLHTRSWKKGWPVDAKRSCF